MSPETFGVKRSKTRSKYLCRSSDRTQHYRCCVRKPRWVFPAVMPRRTNNANDIGFPCVTSPPPLGAERRFFPAWICALLWVHTPRGAGVPPIRLCSSLVHSLPHLLLFITFPLFLFSFTLLIFFYCPSDPFLPESSNSVSRREVVEGDRVVANRDRRWIGSRNVTWP